MVSIEQKSAIFEADFMALGADMNAEIMDGELIIMSPAKPSHARYGSRITALLENFVTVRGLGHVFQDQVPYLMQVNPDGSIRGALVPDASYVSYERLALDADLTKALQVAPNLAVEIISASESMPMILRKTRQYLDFGVEQAWLLFPEAQIVQVCSPAKPLGQGYGIEDTLDAGEVLPGFAIPVRVIFDLTAHDLYTATLKAMLEKKEGEA